jgi:hypothetical protein
MSNLKIAPLRLIRTHVKTHLPIDELLTILEDILNDIPGVEYEFDKREIKWNIFYLKGSTHCCSVVNIYKSESGIIVEVNRLSGDVEGLRIIFNKIKSALDSYSNNRVEYLKPPDKIRDETHSEEEINEFMKPLFRMLQSKYSEERCEATKIICNLTNSAQFHSILCDNLNILLNMFKFEPPIYVIISLANLSESQSNSKALIDAGVLPVLLKFLAENPDDRYNIRELKRQAKRTISNLQK